MKSIMENEIKDLAINVSKIVTYVVLIIMFVTNHVDDGNIFGIFIRDSHLLVGDFWAGLFVVCMVIDTFVSGKYAVLNLIRIRKLLE